MGPELLNSHEFGFENGGPTKGSDCYALGMVLLEVLSGKAPFTPYGETIVAQKVIEGKRPGRPQGAEGVWFTDDLWETLKLCWSPQPKDRPTIQAVLECLERTSAAGQPLPRNADDDAQAVADDELCSGANSCMFLHLRHPEPHTHLRPPSVADCTTTQGGDQPPVLSQSHTRDVAGPAMAGYAQPTPIPPSFPMGAFRNTTYELIYHLTRGNVPQAEIPQVLHAIFDARDYKYSIQGLSEQDIGMWVECLDQVYRL